MFLISKKNKCWNNFGTFSANCESTIFLKRVFKGLKVKFQARIASERKFSPKKLICPVLLG